jgi:glycerophosphoryl diester phosphodiesterase
MVRIIAHRGASAEAPENTLPAFVLARAQGADMLELDVQCCADGTPVVFHDDTIERWSGHPRPVAACSLADMQALDIGGARVPTLEEVCKFAHEYTDIELNIELKDVRCVAPTMALLHTYGIGERVLLSSFSEVALREAQRLAPDIRRACLMGTATYHPATRARELLPLPVLRRFEAYAWHPSHSLPLLRQLVLPVRRAGYEVNVWTVNEPAHMHEVVGMGATGIITDRPGEARRTLQPAN